MQSITKKVSMEQLAPLIKVKLNAGEEVNMMATGNSMAPLFCHMRDQVRLKKVEADEVKVYDMIFYQRDNGKYVLHRIVGKAEKGFILRGDNQICDEYPVRADQVLARVESFCRKGRQMSCHDWQYRCYVIIWTHTVVFRKMYQKVRSFLSRMIHKIVE